MLTEEQRHKMIDSFIGTNGEETAMALAESLFSNDLATKEDLGEVKAELTQLRQDTKDGFSRLDAKLDTLEGKVDSQFRWMVGLLVMIVLTVLGAGVFG